MSPKQVRRSDPAPGDLLDLEREKPGRPRCAVQDLRKMSPAHAEAGCEVGDRLLEGMRMPCHDTSVVCDTIKSRGNEIEPMSFPFDPTNMSPWPQRPTFKAAVLAHRKKHNLSPEEMARLLEVGPSYLHGLLYDKRVFPSLEVIQKAAEVLGMSITRLADDPGAEVPGSTLDSSELDRFMLRVMGSNLSVLTDTQKQAAFEAWNAIIRGYGKE